MNGDLQAARKLLSELREGYQSLPRHLQLRITYVLREGVCADDPQPRLRRPDTSCAKPVIVGPRS